MENWTGILVALGGGAGVALVMRELVGVFGLLRRGVSAREGKRKIDLVQQRDEAIADRENALRDRGRLREYAQELRVMLVERGLERDQLPPWPAMEYKIRPAPQAPTPT